MPSGDQEWTDADFLGVVESLGNPTTAEVVAELGCDGQTARTSLQMLYEQGELEREVIGLAMKWSLSE